MDRVVSVERKNGVATIRFLSGDTVRVPSAVFLERRPRTGDSLDPDAYRLFLLKRGYPHALEAAMKFLALRERSEGEVCKRLKNSCYPEAVIQQVIDTLYQHELLSDSRFAAQWVESRSKKYGRQRISMELRHKGVSEENARQALDALDEADEYGQAVRQAEKLARRFPGDPRRLALALVRRGFGFSLARKAAEQALGNDTENGFH